MQRPRGWIAFDGACALCTRGTAAVARLLAANGWRLVPLQHPRLAGVLTDGRDEMRLLRHQQPIAGGAAALCAIASSYWFLAPLAVLPHLPGVGSLLEQAYVLLARSRHRWL